jgi:hypothetical protein
MDRLNAGEKIVFYRFNVDHKYIGEIEAAVDSLRDTYGDEV